ncbi:MAG: hypothetical protein IKT56_02820 [Clostridia bacterium]|nr:hypothetical protein [Clostridia bacterium]
MIEKIKQTKIDSNKISNLPTRPNSKGLYRDQTYSAQELKARLEALSILAIDKLNEIIDGMAAGGAVAKTMKFKHVDKEYSLAELFSMIFAADGLSDILITDNGISTPVTLNTALSNINSAMQTQYVASASMTLTETGIFLIHLLNKNGEELEQHNFDMSVTSKRIVDKAVTTDKLADRAVATSKLADGAVTEAKLEDKAVTAEKIANSSVTEEKIADKNVTENKLSDDVSGKLNSAIKEVSYDAQSGDLTFVYNGGKEKKIELPLELIVSSGEYDDTENKEAIVLTLANGDKIHIPVNDLIDTIDNRFGDVEKALDAIIEEQKAIIAIQNQLIGGDGK